MREVFFLSSGTFVSPALAVGSSRRVLPSKKTTLSNTEALGHVLLAHLKATPEGRDADRDSKGRDD